MTLKVTDKMRAEWLLRKDTSISESFGEWEAESRIAHEFWLPSKRKVLDAIIRAEHKAKGRR